MNFLSKDNYYFFSVGKKVTNDVDDDEKIIFKKNFSEKIIF